jgi:hypothetical protein
MADPVTPMISTSQMLKPNFTWKKTITVQAGGPMNGTTSTSRDETKTKK